ncbi:hypothetical protein ATANTOWER_022733 [Ataeniobius toweri]|uniref:Uncharacterized protein n=1 Tax=Ataeniobius toweri TaxID=208326 RepID=A0ABU7C9R3_9TELE|nr:hypothetical protein [Ataeniobius toweri]
MVTLHVCSLGFVTTGSKNVHAHVRVMNVSFMGVTSKVSGSGENAALPPRSAQQEKTNRTWSIKQIRERK